VLLTAGSGQRMSPLTAHVPKALLAAGNRAVLDWMIDALIARSGPHLDIVVVTGFEHATVERHLGARYGARVRCAHNARFREDVNILSVATGVAALRDASRGYLICETDLLLDDTAWDTLFKGLMADRSQWICRGRYGPGLTGGIVHADDDGHIDAIDYRPAHDPRFDGWDKMLGMLWVAPPEAAADQHLRANAIGESIAQYYLVPWQQHLGKLPCSALRLHDGFAATFNTPDEYRHATARFTCQAHRAHPSFAL
jgi:hypothetical protein